MQKFTALLYTLMLVIFLAGSGYAITKKMPPKPAHAKTLALKVRTDTSIIQVKQFNAFALKKLKADKDFNYNDRAGAGEPSLWDRFWSWLWEKLFGWINFSPLGGRLILYSLLAAGILFLAYVISKSLGIDAVKLFRGESGKIGVPYTESLENIHEIDFDTEIEKAAAQNNYRLAVRMLYLKSLKLLSDARLIHWQIDKTNSAYLNELANPAQKQSFGLITRQFEYVWYGNFAIDKHAYHNIDRLFHNFKKLMP